MASMPPTNDWVNVAAVRSELPVIRQQSRASKHGHSFEFRQADIAALIGRKPRIFCSGIMPRVASDSVRVGVGIMFAHNPLHGSGQAGFPHPALALGDDAHAGQGVGMTDGRQRQPASDEAPHTLPEDASVLATPLDALSQKRKVIAVELQGHGRTADIDRPLSYEAMAEDIAALMKYLGIERGEVMGYSLGVGVALQTAIRHPAL